MSDLWHEMGGDLAVSATGDIGVAAAEEWGRQRVLRRLLTNPGDNLWSLDYGAGLPRMVGSPADPDRIAAVTRAQMLQEGAVSRSPLPTVEVTVQANGTVTGHVRYADAATGEAQLLNVPVT